MTTISLRAAVERVVSTDNCSGCGGCTALSRNVTMQLDDAGFLRPRWGAPATPDADARDAVRDFRRICPGVAVRAPRESAPHRHPVLGRYVAMWSAWAQDEELRFIGSSGGALSALSDWLLRTGRAGRVVGVGQDGLDPTRTSVQIMRSREDVLAAAGSRYAPVAVLDNAELGADVVQVGKPCEAYAARQLAPDGPTAPVLLSFFCAGVPSQHATDELARGLATGPVADIRELRYRGHGCPGRFTVAESSGATASMSYEQSWGEHLGRRLQDRCKICPDGTGEHADIAVGDYWETDDDGYPVFADSPGRCVLIARTARGFELVRLAIDEGVLAAVPLEPDSAAATQPLQSLRRRSLVGRLIGRRLGGKPVPRFTGQHLVRPALSDLRETIRQARGAYGRTRSAADAHAARREIVVLQSFPAPGAIANPYTELLRSNLDGAPGVRVRTFNWRFAVTGRYDVLHAHWPETLIERRGRLRTAGRQLLYVLILLRVGLGRVVLVRTVHNLELPSGLPWHQRLLLRVTDRLTTLRIVLNESTEHRGETVLIPHGHYRDWYAAPQAREESGRLVFFGGIRRYEHVDLLVSSFRDLSEGRTDWSLHIAGMPSSTELAAEIADLVDSDARITTTFDFVSDADLIALVGEGELVVLPYPEMHSSGSVLAALSLGRPVLVPENEVNRRLAAEVGPGWVFCFDGELSAAALESAVAARRAKPPGEPPRLDQRDWSRGAAEHVAAYRRALLARQGSGQC